MWESNVWFYSIISLQVLVTLVVVPKLVVNSISNSIAEYLTNKPQQIKQTLHQVLALSIKRFSTITLVLACCGLGIVVDAWIHQTELLRWDNQSGIFIISLMAMLSLVYMGFSLHQFRKLAAKHASPIREASLLVRPWRDYLSKSLLFLVLIFQLALIGSICYFLFNPFDGFAGVVNFIGILILDLIFVVSLASQIRKNTWPADLDESLKQYSKRKNCNMLLSAWVMASLYLCISFWLSWFESPSLKLLNQSIYITLLLLVSSRFFRLPNTSSTRV